MNSAPRILISLPLAVALSVPGGCNVRRSAIDETAEVLRLANRAYESESDLELAADALPGSLKLIEGLLQAHPEQPILLALLAEGYVTYAFGFLEDEAERIQDQDPVAAEHLRQRALRLHLRARDYGLRLLALDHPGLAEQLRQGKLPEAEALAQLDSADVAGLFWSASPWGAAAKIGNAEPDLVVQIPLIKALLQRCVELDESFYWGGPHVTLGVLESSTPKAMGGRPDLATQHFERAIELTDGAYLMTRVLYARGVGLQNGDREMFQAQLQIVVDADPAAVEGLGMVNRLAQRRAVRYLAQLDDLFI